MFGKSEKKCPNFFYRCVFPWQQVSDSFSFSKYFCTILHNNYMETKFFLAFFEENICLSNETMFQQNSQKISKNLKEKFEQNLGQTFVVQT